MNIKSKKHWDGFIYGLLYPGFVGSIIYELIDNAKEATSFWGYFTVVAIIKISITLFYSIDYLHLYGDMHPLVDIENRTADYLWCDVFSSLFFFFSFIALKLGYYFWSLMFIGLVPIFFLVYKRKNKADKKFHWVYVGFCLAGLSLYFITDYISPKWRFYEEKWFLFWFVLVELVVYCYYVFSYYEKKSKAIDEKLYGGKIN